MPTKKQPTVTQCVRRLIECVRRGQRPSPTTRQAIVDVEAALNRVSETRRQLAISHGLGRDRRLAEAVVAEIRRSTENTSALSRRLGLSRPTIIKYRKQKTK